MTEKTIIDQRAGGRVRPGTRLNELYEIDSLIAIGGMGEVYRGHAIETGDQVAIKTIRPELAGNGPALALFRKEASALHNLHHGAIVRYYVFSIDRGLDMPYLAMEYVEGEALSDILQRGPLTFEAIETLRRRLASGLQVAHEAGIIHRDVSPDNVILPSGDPARAKIIDFGIARSSLGGQTVIGDGFAGKYGFVSPEQLGLQGGIVTARSDIYSLGLVLAAAALGSPIDMGNNPADVIGCRSRVPDLAGADPRLRSLLTAMLRPDPAQRPGSMAEVASWQPPVVEAPRPAKPAASPFGRGKVLAAAGIALALCAAAGTAFLMQDPWPEQPVNNPLAALDETTPPPRPIADREEPKLPIPPSGQTQDRLPDPPPDRSKPDRPAATNPGAPPRSIPVDTGLDGRGRPEQPPRPVIAMNDVDAPAPPKPVAAPGPTMEQVAAYIREYRGGDCFYLNPTAVSAREAAIEAYGSAQAPFATFDSAFTAALGFEPRIQLRQIDQPQCPVVDVLARQAVQTRVRVPKLVLQRDRVRSGEELRGTIELAEEANLELLLIDGEGIAHNLAAHLTRKGRQASFALRLDTPTAQPARSQLVVAVSSSDSLAFLRDRRNGRTDALFRLIGDEAARPGSPIGLAVRYIRVGS